MSENLLEMSGIEALRKLKEERELILSRLDKMETMRDKVSEAVFSKVRQDYFDRLDRVAAEAAPLKAEVRIQYRVLKKMMDELDLSITSLTLEKEELQFRNELGEFSANVFENEHKKLQLQVTEKEAEFHELEETRNLFLAVFDSLDELEAQNEVPQAPAPIAAQAAVVAPVLALPSEPEPLDDQPAFPDSLAFSDEEDEPIDPNATQAIDFSKLNLHSSPPEDDPIDDTGDLPLPELGDDLGLSEPFEELPPSDLAVEPLPDDMLEPELEPFDAQIPAPIGDVTKPSHTPFPPYSAQPPSPPQPPAPPPPLPPSLSHLDLGATAALPLSSLALGPEPPSRSGDGTMIISNPKIIAQNQAIEGQVFSLGMGTTSMGRSPDNDIHLMEDRISRKHAQIAFGPGGYALYDLNSENGTYVNGQRIREHFMADGDIVMIGSFKFLYRDH